MPGCESRPAAQPIPLGRNPGIRYRGAAGVDGADAVQGGWVGDGVAVYGQDVGVEAGCDAALAVSEPDHPGRDRGEHPQRLGLEPTKLSDGLLEEGREIAQRYRDRVDPSKIIARSVWRKGMETAEDLLTDLPDQD